MAPDLPRQTGALQLAYAETGYFCLKLAGCADGVSGDPKLDLPASGDPVDFLVCADGPLNFVLLAVYEFCYFGRICMSLRKQWREDALLLLVLIARWL